MSKAVPSTVAQSWAWGSKIAVKKIRIKLMLLIPFSLDLRTNLRKNIEIEMPLGENFAVNNVCENSSNEKLKILFRKFSYG